MNVLGVRGRLDEDGDSLVPAQYVRAPLLPSELESAIIAIAERQQTHEAPAARPAACTDAAEPEACSILLVFNFVSSAEIESLLAS